MCSCMSRFTGRFEQASKNVPKKTPIIGETWTQNRQKCHPEDISKKHQKTIPNMSQNWSPNGAPEWSQNRQK